MCFLWRITDNRMH